ncbi:MAG: hypothetical protein ACLTOU_02120 [Acutalibacter sp.]
MKATKAKKILALLLALALCLSLFTACGGDNGSSSEGSKPASTTSTEESGGEEGGGAEEGDTGITFPLDEPVTLTAWNTPPSSNPALGIVTYNDIPVLQAWEEATNVHIEWDIPAAGQETESFNLMITSGEYPDLISGIDQRYVGGIDKAVEDGVIIAFNDMMETYAPDYWKLINKDETLLRDCVTDGGNYAEVFMVNVPDQGPWYGMAVRQDWLDDCGLDTPVTYDDWYEMLKAFKEQKGATAPLWLNCKASDMFGVFAAGYGVGTLGLTAKAPFYQVDGTVKYGPYEEGYREYLTMLNKWYAEGLLDPDYYTRTTDTQVPSTLADTGASGAWPDIYTLLEVHNMVSEDPNIDVVAVPAPVKNEGDQLHLRQYNFTRGNGGFSISTACENPELALAWLNRGSQEDVSLSSYYGEEGVTYTMVDGKPQYTDLILNNPDGFSFSDALIKYTWRSPGIYQWDRELQGVSEKALDAINDIWPSNADGDYVMPNVSLTNEEGNQFSTIMGDLDTYVSEMTTKFILGDEPLDNYDAFVETMKSMGVEDAIALYQAALDRWNAR